MVFQSIRYVVVHEPGPRWPSGISFREQQGVGEHVRSYRQLRQHGKLKPGGPFLLPDRGDLDLMITTSAVTQTEKEAFAAEAPAVKSGPPVFEVRPWMTAVERA